jgi:hypothetical protein
MAVLALLVSIFALMLVRVHLPSGVAMRGRRVGEVSLSLWERALYHRAGLYALGIVLLLLSLAGGIGAATISAAALGALAVLMLPVRYRFTSEGVGLNNVLFRSWGEFSGVERHARGLRLLARDGLPSLDLRLLGTHQDEALRLLPSWLTAAREQTVMS